MDSAAAAQDSRGAPCWQSWLSSSYLLYKFVLHYDPSPKRFPSNAHPVHVDIECRYPRNHYLHKLAIQPTWQTPILHKRLRATRGDFQIQLMDDTWENQVKSKVFQLGEMVNFQVSALLLTAGQKLYIKNCFAAPVSDSKPNVKFTLIDNYGCLIDSKLEPGASKFVSQTDESIRFSMKAFQFVTDPDAEISMHCQLYVSSAGPSQAHKACTYTQTGWEALSGDDVICKCCDSRCVTSKRQRAMMDGVLRSESLWVSNHPDSSSRPEHTGVDKRLEGTGKETADLAHVEIKKGDRTDLEEPKWHQHDAYYEEKFVVEDIIMLNVTTEDPGYQPVVSNKEADIREKVNQGDREDEDTTWIFNWT
ncbi:unnamed protein product [Knipowitschia caucasica]